MRFFRSIFAGIVGGAVGGALVGLAEAAVVALVSDASEYWAFAFGTATYAAIGAALGGGWGFLDGLRRRFQDGAATLATAGALTAALLGIVVARFRVIRDVFAESLAIGSRNGMLVHLALLAGGVVVYVLVRALLARSARGRAAGTVAARWLGGLAVISALLAVVLTFWFGASEVAEAPTPATARGPNAILIIADTLRADHTGPYGGRGVSTPAIDRLARDGIVFDHVYANSSWTRPSIATILSSLHASSHSVMYKTDLLPDAVETLAEVMRAGGYRTAGFVTNINVAPSFHFEQGFDTYRYLAPDFFFGATDSGSKLSLYSGMRLIRERFISRKKYVANYYQDAATVGQNAVPWLDKHAREPFFALIHYMDPHDPYFHIPYNGEAVARVDTPNPDPSRAEELRLLYASNIEYMDRFIAKMIDQLEAVGVYDDTVIVFTADHGEEFQEHGGWWHGTTLYDEEVHVPLIVKLPKKARAGTRDDAPAGLIDVMPTLVAAAGLRCPAACQGRDLMGSAPAPSAAFAEEDHEGNVLRSIRTKEWKLILANPGNPRGLAPVELYDLAEDPGERRNMAKEQQSRVETMMRDLDVLQQATRAAAVKAKTGALDDASKERLRALGYIQ